MVNCWSRETTGYTQEWICRYNCPGGYGAVHPDGQLGEREQVLQGIS